jgi:F-type H+-transporting ATPase subunit gamma
MPSLRDIRNRIQSVKNTRQITRAMKLVAGAKLKRATDAAVAARPYQKALSETIARVATAAGDVEHPLLMQPANKNDVLVVVLSSDRGLCGSFNGTLLRRTEDAIKELQKNGKSVRVVTYGKKAAAYFAKRGYPIQARFIDLRPARYKQLADELTALLIQEIQAGSFSEAILAFNEFKSVMTQIPKFEVVLPMKLTAGEDAVVGNYIFEPSGQEILAELLPKALRTRLFQAFLETEAGEQGARMSAMDSATRNASELIDALTLQYNRARQAAITKELIEIVSGAEAL